MEPVNRPGDPVSEAADALPPAPPPALPPAFPPAFPPALPLAFPSALPPESGAYILWIDLDRPLTLALPRLGSPVLRPGRYAYCGSARGPGGIRARVARHLRSVTSPARKAHWHVDRLTAAGHIVAALVAPGGNECALMDTLLARDGAAVPVPGFGSSDCRRCAAHLVAFGGAPSLEAVAPPRSCATLLVLDRARLDRRAGDRDRSDRDD